MQHEAHSSEIFWNSHLGEVPPITLTLRYLLFSNKLLWRWLFRSSVAIVSDAGFDSLKCFLYHIIFNKQSKQAPEITLILSYAALNHCSQTAEIRYFSQYRETAVFVSVLEFLIIFQLIQVQNFASNDQCIYLIHELDYKQGRWLIITCESQELWNRKNLFIWI